MTVKMPDVSEFQSGATAPNWGGIKSQNGGAGIIRVGYGITHLDGMFVSNYTALKSNGFAFKGLYHYLRADQDARAQAVAFCNWVGPLSALAPGSIPMLDLEEGSGNQLSRANTWLNFVDHFYGLDQLPLDKRSWLYSGQSFSVSSGLSPIFNSARHTWIAAYQFSEAGLQPHTLWQSTNGQVGANRTNWSGVGFCDTSITSHSLSELASMAYQPQGVPSTPQPVPTISEEENMLAADRKTTAVSFSNGQYDWISFFSDPGVESKDPQAIRLAMYADGNFTIANVTVGPSNEKVTVQLPTHCAGIGISRPGTDPNGDIWAPVAWNLGSNA